MQVVEGMFRKFQGNFPGLVSFDCGWCHTYPFPTALKALLPAGTKDEFQGNDIRWGFVMVFDSDEARKAYDEHPFHLDIVRNAERYVAGGWSRGVTSADLRIP